MDPKTPILVGGFRFTEKPKDLSSALSPIDLMVHVAKNVANDTTLGETFLQNELETISVVRLSTDTFDNNPYYRMYNNIPSILANKLNIPNKNLKNKYYGVTGGNTPQFMINELSSQISTGKIKNALIIGCEALDTFVKLISTGNCEWGKSEKEDKKIDQSLPEMIGKDPPYISELEGKCGLGQPITIYPLFENALRFEAKHTLNQHLQFIGNLFESFNKVALNEDNLKHAWLPYKRTSQEIATLSASNRWVGFPYLKYMNAIIRVNQSAGILLTSIEEATKLKIPQEKWIYIHGVCDVNEYPYFISERPELHRSLGMEMLASKLFKMANISSIDEIDLIDLYSCFPSAVQMGINAFKISYDKQTGLRKNNNLPLTITGGLPYHGGPGNNYVLHSVVALMEKLRTSKPDTKGLVTAIGWFCSKHSAAIYSNSPPKNNQKFIREDPTNIQAEIEEKYSKSKVEVVEKPQGVGKIETYTIISGRKGPKDVIIIGRLQDGQDKGKRFIANTPPHDAELKKFFMTNECLGLLGNVTSQSSGPSLFTPLNHVSSQHVTSKL